MVGLVGGANTSNVDRERVALVAEVAALPLEVQWPANTLIDLEVGGVEVGARSEVQAMGVDDSVQAQPNRAWGMPDPRSRRRLRETTLRSGGSSPWSRWAWPWAWRRSSRRA